MAHVLVPEAEALLDVEIPVLDKGFVRLVDYMGGDQRVVQSARVSYGEGTKSVRQDQGLIHYLMKHHHTSPFEQVILTFHAKMPIFVARQWVRHRTARLNEISGRYSVMRDEFYVPSPETLKLQSANNKQARDEDSIPFDQAIQLVQQIEEDQNVLYEHYQNMIDQELAREVARINLPLSLYTEWYWQIDLHNLLHFIRLRLDAHAQYEIRVYAEALAKCAKAVAPYSYEAFEEHVLKSVTFSRAEAIAISKMLEGQDPQLEDRALKNFQEKISKIKSF